MSEDRAARRLIVSGLLSIQGSAHHRFSQDPATETLPLTWNAASGVPAAASIAAIDTRLPLLFPAEDEDLLHEAGVTAITRFHPAFTFRGWSAYKA